MVTGCGRDRHPVGGGGVRRPDPGGGDASTTATTRHFLVSATALDTVRHHLDPMAGTLDRSTALIEGVLWVDIDKPTAKHCAQGAVIRCGRHLATDHYTHATFSRKILTHDVRNPPHR